MYPGKYPHRVIIKEPVISTDEIGNQTTTALVELGEAWASIAPLSGKEYVAAAQTQSKTTHKITMATPPFEVKTSCICIHAGKTYEIDSVVDNLRGEIAMTATVRG